MNSISFLNRVRRSLRVRLRSTGIRELSNKQILSSRSLSSVVSSSSSVQDETKLLRELCAKIRHELLNSNRWYSTLPTKFKRIVLKVHLEFTFFCFEKFDLLVESIELWIHVFLCNLRRIPVSWIRPCGKY